MPVLTPGSLAWRSQAFLDRSTIWIETVYQHFQTRPQVGPPRRSISPRWHKLPFDDTQVVKIPKSSGLYMFLSEHEIWSTFCFTAVLYVGETRSLRRRFNQYLEKKSRVVKQSIPSIISPAEEERGISALFAYYSRLTFCFCEVDVYENDRKELERQLIGVFDPPINSYSRPNPRGPALTPLRRVLTARLGSPRTLG